jgi:hypothetical protein
MTAGIWADWLDSSVDRRLNAYKELLHCRSPGDFARIQGRLASAAVSSWVDASSRVLTQFRNPPW